MEALMVAQVPALVARFPLEIHIWTIPLLFATGWVIGYVHFRDALHRKHPDLWREWRRRTDPGAETGPDPEREPRTDPRADPAESDAAESGTGPRPGGRE